MLFSTLATATIALAASFVSATPTAEKRDAITFVSLPPLLEEYTPEQSADGADIQRLRTA